MGNNGPFCSLARAVRYPGLPSRLKKDCWRGRKQAATRGLADKMSAIFLEVITPCARVSCAPRSLHFLLLAEMPSV